MLERDIFSSNPFINLSIGAMPVLIGNIISFIACVIMVISGYIKSKDKTLTLQTIQIALSAVSCLFLSAYSGAIINLLSVPRNILAQKNKLSMKYKIVLLTATVGLSCSVTLYTGLKQGYIEWIGFVPLISTVTYMLLMDKLNEINFKKLIIFTMIVWIIHDAGVKNYVSVVFNTLNIITSYIAIYRIRKQLSVNISPSS